MTLEKACKKHNITKAIYEYYSKMEWGDSDRFDSDLVLEMVSKGVIEEGNQGCEEEYEYDESEKLKAKFKLVKQQKGCNIVRYGNWFDDDRKTLEDIYKDGDWKLIWLN